VTYIEKVAKEIGARCGMEWGICSNDDMDLLMIYALVGLIVGNQIVLLKDVHDAWSLWRNLKGNRGHPCLVPFDELSAEDKAKDEPYRKAIDETMRMFLNERARA
jgi:hypothetical protein